MAVAIAGRDGLASSFLQNSEFRGAAIQHSIEHTMLHSRAVQDELLVPLLTSSDSGLKGDRDEASDFTIVESQDESEALDIGLKKHGCAHYRRRCRIRAPCCNEVYDCRHCHNEVMNAYRLESWKKHDMPRHEVETVICSLCNTEQKVQQVCEKCGVCMGKYFCGKCKFFDDDNSKGQFHCDSCGICRVGGKHNFFHCDRCGCCYSKTLEQGHPCVENAMHHNCPVCFEYLFDSMKPITVMKCGHTMHETCLDEMHSHNQFSCPICSKSTLKDMSAFWEERDREVAATPMPVTYQNKQVRILCNDCSAQSDVIFHIVGLKCPGCSSYNTRQVRGRTGSSSERR